jgi:hypothetical protein
MPTAIPPAPMRLVCRVDGEFTMYAWLYIVVVAWEGPATVSGMRHFVRAIELPRTVETPFSVVHLLQGRTGLPSAEVRAEFERLSKGHAQAIVCAAILDHRQGFVAGAVKAVLTGVSLIARARVELRMFGDLEELISWLARKHESRTGVQVDLAGLREAVRAVNERHPVTA